MPPFPANSKKRSGDAVTGNQNFKMPRRSGRASNKPDFVEVCKNECFGLWQPGYVKRNAKEELDIEKEQKGTNIWLGDLQPAGWKWQRRGDGYVYRAPGVTKKDEVVNVNMFTSYKDMYEQFERDGHTVERILERSGRNPNSKVDRASAVEEKHTNLTSAKLPKVTPVQRSIKQRLDRIEKESGLSVSKESLLFERIEYFEKQLGLVPTPDSSIVDRVVVLEETMGLSSLKA